MAEIIDPKKKLNHKWKTDPRFIKDFDYEKPEYADVPNGLKWALPIHESANRPEEIQRQKRLQEKAQKKLELERRAGRLAFRKLSTINE